MENKTLSDKIIEYTKELDYALDVDDVKEFIKELKKLVEDRVYPDNQIEWLNYQIDKLAGEKLIQWKTKIKN